jgi:NAD(P)-dependent dehydrogenase (short-subunit alcohol dehydrogenase family)
MTQQICLVTGANSGIGKEIALALAVAGAHVIMVCRNEEKSRLALEEIKTTSGSTSIDLLIADLSSQTEIHLLAKTLHERYSKLHVLINNAGVVVSKKTLSIDGIEMMLATNHLGSFLLTNLLLDLLQKSEPSRIINISSAIHKWAKIDLNDLQYEHRNYHFMKAYAQSKLLMNIVTFELSRRVADSGVTVNCVHPGAVKTGLGSDNANTLVLKCIDKMIKFFFINPQEAAKTPLHLAISPEMQGITGKYFVKSKPTTASSLCYDPFFAKRVWEISNKLVGA